MDETCLAVGAVAEEGSFQGGEGTRVEAGVGEDLAEVGWSAGVDSGGCFNPSSGYFPILLVMYCRTKYNDASA